jgi:hypothetical protein
VQFLGFRRCKRSLEGRSAGRNLAGDGDDAAGRVVAGEGEEQILGFVVRVLGLRMCKESLERGRIWRRGMEELTAGEEGAGIWRRNGVEKKSDAKEEEGYSLMGLGPRCWQVRGVPSSPPRSWYRSTP